MARGPHSHEDRSRLERIRYRERILREERTKRVDGSVVPTHGELKDAVENLVYEDIGWLLERIERNWD